MQPKQVFGNALLPLNQVLKYDKVAFDEKVKKYKGREVLLERFIPKLNCLWNDVLFFSPVHPKKIKMLYEEIELKWALYEWFELNPNDIHSFKENAVIYDIAEKQKGDFSIDENEIRPFSLKELEKRGEIPDATIRYYRNAKASGEPIFTFYLIPHILYKGAIPFSKLKNLTVKD